MKNIADIQSGCWEGMVEEMVDEMVEDMVEDNVEECSSSCTNIVITSNKLQQEEYSRHTE